MDKTLEAIGINTEQLNSKVIHNRVETEKLLGVTNQTLNTFKRKGWLKTSRYKNKNYYTTQSIKECIKSQLFENEYEKRKLDKEWESLWK